VAQAGPHAVLAISALPGGRGLMTLCTGGNGGSTAHTWSIIGRAWHILLATSVDALCNFASDMARHISQRIVNPRLLSSMASCDVASDI